MKIFNNLSILIFENIMKTKSTLILIVLLIVSATMFAQKKSEIDTLLPVRGFCISAPKPDNADRFIDFINDELAVLNVNTLVLRVDYNYQYTSHPELRDSAALSKEQVKNIVKVCRKNDIRIIPQINLLGHQSWAGELNNLLKEYPEFDETPRVEMPEDYKWPNKDGLYCKSYCPLHPKVHDVVFSIVDEILEVFEADAFHAGMDEVFYIADDKCPRCSGKDPAELFAGEVTKIRNHLAQKNIELWIWGDRLIDGKTTGMGMWEASMNNTHRAVNLIPEDVVICDWHYERPDPTAVYFAMKGFRVITCPYHKPDVALKQLEEILEFRENSTGIMKDKFAGMMQTVWSPAEMFMDSYYEKDIEKSGKTNSADCFKALFREINELYEL